MLLAVAARPSSTSVGVFERSDGSAAGPALLRTWRVATDERRTADDHGRLLRALLSELVDPPALSGVVVASVVPGVAVAVREAVLARRPGLLCVVLGPGVRTGLAVRTDDPREVGVDRVANAVAAVARHGGPCVVVDVGSVTTVDAVNAKGEHVGGAIAPGLDLGADALHRHAPALRRVELARPRRAIGRTTAEALQAGVVYGAAGCVDGLVERVSSELAGPPAGGRAGSRPTVVATGAYAPLVVADSRTVDIHEPDLTLHGLRIVFSRQDLPPRR